MRKKDFDLDDETNQCKALAIVVILFIVSIFVTWSEAKYFFFSKTTDAVVTSRQRVVDHGKYGREIPKLEITYDWPTPAKGRRESVDVDPDYPVPAIGGKIRIQYLADTSRLAGTYSVLGPLFFIGSLAALLYFCVKIWKESRNDPPTR